MPAVVRVWDPLVRLAHWLLVASVFAGWFTREGWGVWHERIGYVALALVVLRLVWGFVGPRHARFADFVRAPSVMFDYARRVARAGEPRYLGHNPLGGWMIVCLLVVVALVSGTGWLYTTDRYWGVEWVGELHEALTWTLFALVALHISGVIYASLRHRENLVASMVHGMKRAEDATAQSGRGKSVPGS